MKKVDQVRALKLAVTALLSAGVFVLSSGCSSDGDGGDNGTQAGGSAGKASGGTGGGAGGTKSTGGSGGTTTTGGTTSSGGTTSAGGDGAGGDGADTCTPCIGEKCSDEVQACEANAECKALLGCIAACKDQACLTGCNDAHPDGQEDFNAVFTCTSTDCKTECGL